MWTLCVLDFNMQYKLSAMDKESDQLGKRHEVLELHNEVLWCVCVCVCVCVVCMCVCGGGETVMVDKKRL